MSSVATDKERGLRIPSGMQYIASYARLKPLAVGGVSTERSGGIQAGKQIEEYDGTSVTSAGKRFEHLTGTILPDATQLQVYQSVAQPLVRSWLDGFDVDLLSYGQTGSGKTFTIFGPPLSMEHAAQSLGAGKGQGTSGEGILRPEHGFILRSGLEALAAVEAMNRGSGGAASRAVLHGSTSLRSAQSRLGSHFTLGTVWRRTCAERSSPHHTAKLHHSPARRTLTSMPYYEFKENAPQHVAGPLPLSIYEWPPLVRPSARPGRDEHFVVPGPDGDRSAEQQAAGVRGQGAPSAGQLMPSPGMCLRFRGCWAPSSSGALRAIHSSRRERSWRRSTPPPTW